MPNISNLFAIIDDVQSPIKRIPLTEPFHRELGQLFIEQQERFIRDKEPVDFNGRYNVDVGEIFRIENYPLPVNILNALENPLNYQILSIHNENNRIKALFTGYDINHQTNVSFQVFNTSKLLRSGWTLIGNGRSYTKLVEPGLMLQEKLTSHFQDGFLYFVSYHNTKRFLSLSNYYIEATDTDLENFAQNRLFEFEDRDSFRINADTFVRKKIALLQRNNVLDNLTIDSISEAINDFNNSVADEHNINISIMGGRIIIPRDKKQLKELIRFLDEDYMTTPLSKRVCLTNSKQYLATQS